MHTNLNSRELEPHENIISPILEPVIPSNKIYRLLLLSLLLSLLSTLLAIFVTIKSRQETEAANNKKKQTGTI